MDKEVSRNGSGVVEESLNSEGVGMRDVRGHQGVDSDGSETDLHSCSLSVKAQSTKTAHRKKVSAVHLLLASKETGWVAG